VGTLTKLNIIGSESAEANTRVAFRQEVVNAMRTGEVLLFGTAIASPGGPIPIGPALAPVYLAMAAQGLEDYPVDFERQTADVMIEGYKFVDEIPDSNILFNIVPPLKDWTFPLLPIVNLILELLGLLKIPDPPKWLRENIPKIIEKSKEFGEAVTELATECKPSKLAKLLNEIDPSIDPKKAEEEMNKPIGDTGKRMCELIVSLELPEFKLPPLPVPFIKPWTWPAFTPPFFPIPPADIPFPILTMPTWPAPGWNLDPIPINWVFELKIIPAILKAIEKLVAKAMEIVNAIREGVEAAIRWIIEFLVKEIIQPVMEAIGDMIRKYVMLAAVVAVFIKNMIASLVVSILGLLLGAGLFTWSAAYILGLLPEGATAPE